MNSLSILTIIGLTTPIFLGNIFGLKMLFLNLFLSTSKWNLPSASMGCSASITHHWPNMKHLSNSLRAKMVIQKTTMTESKSKRFLAKIRRRHIFHDEELSHEIFPKINATMIPTQQLASRFSRHFSPPSLFGSTKWQWDKQAPARQSAFGVKKSITDRVRMLATGDVQESRLKACVQSYLRNEGWLETSGNHQDKPKNHLSTGADCDQLQNTFCKANFALLILFRNNGILHDWFEGTEGCFEASSGKIMLESLWSLTADASGIRQWDTE